MRFFSPSGGGLGGGCPGGPFLARDGTSSWSGCAGDSRGATRKPFFAILRFAQHLYFDMLSELGDDDGDATTVNEQNQCHSGQTLGSRWRVRRRVGKGTFSEIYEAADMKQERGADGRHPHVAIKVAREGQKRSMLLHEEEVLKALQDSQVVPTLVELGRDGSTHYLVMQLLGENLSNMRRLTPDKRLSLRMITLLGVQIAEALGKMHDCGYIHRDIKPSNCCIGLQDESTCYLLDFGLVRARAARSSSAHPSFSLRRAARLLHVAACAAASLSLLCPAALLALAPRRPRPGPSKPSLPRANPPRFPVLARAFLWCLGTPQMWRVKTSREA